jgi:hypothetical protein
MHFNELYVVQISFDSFFNFAPDNLVTLLLGKLCDAKIRNPRGKSG